MNIKGLSDNQTNIDTPNDVGASEKPLNIEQTPKNRRVDINVLKSRLEDRESKEFKKKRLCAFILGYRSSCFRNLSFFIRNLQTAIISGVIWLWKI